MKKAGWIVTVAAGVVLVGGGAWGATLLAASDDTAAVVETAAPTSAASATPEATPTAAPTPGPISVSPTEDVPSSAPVVGEEQLREVLDYYLTDLGVTQDELVQAAYWVCEQDAQGVQNVRALEGADEQTNMDFNVTVRTYLCPNI